MPKRSPRNSSKKVLWIVLACVGECFLVCGGLIVVVLAINAFGTGVNSPYTGGGVPSRLREDTEQVASKFLTDLCAGQAQAAWEQTSAGFQNGHSTNGGDPKFLADFLQENPGLKDPAGIEVKSQYADIQQATVQGFITTKSGKEIIVNLKLTKVMGNWKISDMAASQEREKGVGKKK